MINKFSIYTIQVSFLLLETTSNLIQPQYSVKVLNTENVILSLGDVDDDTNYDLEIIKNHPENSLLEKKLYEFHKYINLAEKTERPKERQFRPSKKVLNYKPMNQIHYPDSPYEIASDERHLSMLERRRRKKKKMKLKERRKKNRSKRLAVYEFYGEQSDDMIPVPEFMDVEDVEAEFDSMAKEYFDYLENSQKKHTAFKYSDEGKPEENLKDVILKIVDLRTPSNCTNITGIGVQAMECIVKNFQDGVFDKKQMMYGICFIILLWIGIYLAIALPLWCAKGWCCCCCRCSFCFPTETVREIQKFLAQNPPGVIINSLGEEEHYNPTPKETELYERIKRAIAEF